MPRTVARADSVPREQLLDFLLPRHHGLLATTRRDGRPQLSPLACGLDAAGRLVMSTYPERAKTRNARRDPRVSVLVLSDDWDGPWVQVDGTAEVLDAVSPGGDPDPTALDAFVEYYRGIGGEHPDWAEYREAMVEQGKSLLRVTVQRWGPIATGGFPARLVA